MSTDTSTKRPKGFVSWRPQSATRRVLDQVNEVFEEYKSNLPLTYRQIFYRLVGQYEFPKTEKDYTRLCEYLVRARRSGLVPFAHIRDDGTLGQSAGGMFGVDSFFRRVKSQADGYYRHRALGQEKMIEVWCEAKGMVPQIAGVALPYGVNVRSTGGFSSVTVTHQTAERICRIPYTTVFLHVGDFDPSGQSIYEAMAEDIDTFVTQYKHTAEKNEYAEPWDWVDPDSGFEYHRVALTEEQVTEYDLPTAPPKPSDSRTARWDAQTCQAEAMAPNDLADVVRDAVVSHMDMDEYHRQIVLGHSDKREIKKRLEAIS